MLKREHEGNADRVDHRLRTCSRSDWRLWAWRPRTVGKRRRRAATRPPTRARLVTNTSARCGVGPDVSSGPTPSPGGGCPLWALCRGGAGYMLFKGRGDGGGVGREDVNGQLLLAGGGVGEVDDLWTPSPGDVGPIQYADKLRPLGECKFLEPSHKTRVCAVTGAIVGQTQRSGFFCGWPNGPGCDVSGMFRPVGKDRPSPPPSSSPVPSVP